MVCPFFGWLVGLEMRASGEGERERVRFPDQEKHHKLRLEPVLDALAAGAHGHVLGGQGLVLAGVLPDLCDGVDDAADEANEDGADGAEGDGGVEEDEAADGDGELVEGADHGVGGGGGDAHAPCRGVGDEDGRQAGEDHGEDDGGAVLDGEVLLQVGVGPVLDEDGRDEQDGDGEEVVVEHG